MCFDIQSMREKFKDENIFNFFFAFACTESLKMKIFSKKIFFGICTQG